MEKGDRQEYLAICDGELRVLSYYCTVPCVLAPYMYTQGVR